MGKLELGWQEWVSLPDLGLPAVKAKIDTGARTSALHAVNPVEIAGAGAARLRFTVQPVPRRPEVAITCEAPLVGVRDVISSNGERERRYVVRTRLAIADEAWPVEITLTDRAQMRTRMLIGRQAIAGRGIIDPERSFLQPRLSWRSYRERE